MIPDFLQSPDSLNHYEILRTIIGLVLVLFAIFVGVEIKIENEDDEQEQ
tara:strand:+ start:139 stop:285 length:147 start_codon:yes stop_codon:yes gene_type:complete